MTIRLGRRDLMAGAAAAGATALIGRRALADLSIDITRGQVQPLPIAISNFHSPDPSAAKIGSDISSVISANLERSGLFKPIDPRAFIQTPEALQAGPRFGDWRVINAQALVGGAVRQLPDGRVRTEFRLWDVAAEQQLIGVAYTSDN